MQGSGKAFFIIGHRGAAGERLENSMGGFRHALGLDIDAIEIDVREHGGALWVFHDHQLERLTGTAKSFDSHADIGTIKLNNGELVPSLKQVLDLAWGKMPLNISIEPFYTYNDFTSNDYGVKLGVTFVMPKWLTH